MTNTAIKVGMIAEQTGPLSFMGCANANVAKMVIDDINASGGLLGRNLDLYLEDGATTIVNASGQSEPRGNDMWICLPDGADDDNQTDGCVRFASLRDTTSEPSGFIFLASGEAAFVNLQHRASDEAAGRGSLIKISGFKVQDNQ